jgi:hypothetical protein
MLADCRESVVPRIGQDIAGQKLWLQFSWHLRDFWCWKPYQKVQSSIRIISFTRYFQDYTVKRREFHAKRAFQYFQFKWTIRCAIMVTRSLGNLPREALNEVHTRLILQK